MGRGLYRLVVISVLGLLASQSVLAEEQFTVIDVPIIKAYVPAAGFDDNDAIEVVLQGELPSPCFTLGKAVAGPMVDNGFLVRQLAWKNTSEGCGTERSYEPVPYTSVVSLGRLKRGDYHVHYSKIGGDQKRNFNVESAKKKETDNFDYAAIQAAEMKDIYFEENEVFVTLTGVWTTKCQALEKPIKIERQDDLFLIFPILTAASKEPCEKAMIPFSEIVSLGTLAKGSYLVHSRSRGGQAIYKSFLVWPYVGRK